MYIHCDKHFLHNRMPYMQIIASRNFLQQITWIPNEIENFDIILVDFLDRITNPKCKYNNINYIIIVHVHITHVAWLLKLHECISPNGLLVISASKQWPSATLQKYIGKW